MKPPKIATQTCFACVLIVMTTAGFPAKGGMGPTTIYLSTLCFHMVPAVCFAVHERRGG
jgi:hypothetical protein